MDEFTTVLLLLIIVELPPPPALPVRIASESTLIKLLFESKARKLDVFAIVPETTPCTFIVFDIDIAPVSCRVEPSKVKFASPSSSVVVAPIVVSLFSTLLFNAVIVPPPLLEEASVIKVFAFFPI